jgi:hypothetical protein
MSNRTVSISQFGLKPISSCGSSCAEQSVGRIGVGRSLFISLGQGQQAGKEERL